jgi:hypothetical protein
MWGGGGGAAGPFGPWPERGQINIYLEYHLLGYNAL